MTTPESRVIIVGGGVFGLSTALWLARNGYEDVSIFDRYNFDTNYYNPTDGCDGASADIINKTFRATTSSEVAEFERRLIYSPICVLTGVITEDSDILKSLSG